MESLRLYVYSKENPTPRQRDAFHALVEAWGRSRNVTVAITSTIWSDRKLLVLGSEGPPEAGHMDMQYTYSPKQMESRANATTVIHAALDIYFDKVQGIPEDHAVHVFYTSLFAEGELRNFDLTRPIAVDVETGGVLGENVSARTAPMLCIAFAQDGKAITLALKLQDSMMSDGAIQENLEFLQQFLPKIQKPVFHNGKFDIAVIEHNTGVRMPNFFDTMLAHHVLNMAAREHGLKALCRRYFNAPDWENGIKEWIKGKSQDYSVIPYSILGTYNGWDVLWTMRLYEMLSVLIDADEDAQSALYLEMQVADFLSGVEATGIPFSPRQSRYLSSHYAVVAEEAKVKLERVTNNQKFNPGSPKQVKEWLESKGFTVTSTNEESIDKIKDIAERQDLRLVVSFCTALIQYRKAKKMSGTYVDAWRKASKVEGDGRVHPTFHVHGTTTGRLSSSDPNAQNVPRDKTIRKMVTIDE